jgi:hypothetical protein
MDAFELFNEHGKTMGVWCCGKCRKLTLSPLWHPSSSEARSTREGAEMCCTVPKCTTCGAEDKAAERGECSKCQSVRWNREQSERLAKRLAAAEDVTATYEGPVYLEDGPTGDMGDHYFSSAEVAAEYLEDDEEERDGEVWAFACRADIRGIDIDRALEQVCDDGYEDMGDRIEIPKSLRDAVDAFNKENEVAFTVYETDYRRKVLIVPAARFSCTDGNDASDVRDL